MSELAPLTITIPLTLDAHMRAEAFRHHHVQPKAKQVYLNSLAVSAVNLYLQRLEFETDLAAGASSNPVLQMMLDVADLVITDYGTLECRPVLPGADLVHIPPEVWGDRIGYVAVLLHDSLREATLLGFTESVTTDYLPLTALKPLEELLGYLTVKYHRPSAQPAVLLSQWLQNRVDAAWQTAEELFGWQTPAWQYRSATTQPLQWVSRGKILNLGDAPNQQQVALVVEVSPKQTAEVDITVKICPTQGYPHLPANLELMILDETGVAVIQAQARTTEMINVEFSGEMGDQFSTKVVIGERNAVDTFII